MQVVEVTGSGRKSCRGYWIILATSIVFLLSANGSVRAQIDSVRRVVDTPARGVGVLVAPFVQYAPETRFVGGLAWFLRFHIIGDTGEIATRPSSISGSGSYTQNKQFSSGIYFDFYFPDDIYHWSGGLDFKRFPFDFYGVGDYTPASPTDTYTQWWLGFHSEFTRNFNDAISKSFVDLSALRPGAGLNIGLGMQVRSDRILSSNAGGPIVSGVVPGSDGGLTSGFGIVVNYDTRDNIYSPFTGDYVAGTAYVFGEAFGSEFSDVRYTLDLRKYIPIFGSESSIHHTLALQGLVTIVDGFEPFYEMAALGGDQTMRGYYLGQFRDNDMMVLQAEYRMPVYWRFGLVAFGDLGEVAGNLHAFSLPGVRYTYGVGLRVMLEEDERLGVRLDYGIGEHSTGLYFSYLEAF